MYTHRQKGCILPIAAVAKQAQAAPAEDSWYSLITSLSVSVPQNPEMSKTSSEAPLDLEQRQKWACISAKDYILMKPNCHSIWLQTFKAQDRCSSCFLPLRDKKLGKVL